MISISIKSPAKINIGLRILNKREDGFHNIHTLFYPIIDLFDEIIFAKSNHNYLNGDFPAELKNENNLILKAKSYLEIFVQAKLNCSITLNKHIPIGAGLGGGSSNAAATLLALNELFDLKINCKTLHKFALQLGSDVPFFLEAKPAIGKSRGEELEIVDIEIPFPILLVNPGIHISTKDAFSKLKPLNVELDYFNLDFNSKLGLMDLQNKLENDFEEIIFKEYSEIHNIYKTLISNNALFSKMTGTGSTVFGIFETIDEAKKINKKIPSRYFRFINTD